MRHEATPISDNEKQTRNCNELNIMIQLQRRNITNNAAFIYNTHFIYTITITFYTLQHILHTLQHIIHTIQHLKHTLQHIINTKHE